MEFHKVVSSVTDTKKPSLYFWIVTTPVSEVIQCKIFVKSETSEPHTPLHFSFDPSGPGRG